MPGAQEPAKPCHSETLAGSARSPISAQRVGKPRQQEPSISKVTHGADSQRPGIQGRMLSPEHPGPPLAKILGLDTEEEQTFPESCSSKAQRKASTFHPGVLTRVPFFQRKQRP